VSWRDNFHENHVRRRRSRGSSRSQGQGLGWGADDDGDKWGVVALKKKGILKTLFTNPRTCIGCRSCELACSFNHYKENNPARALLRIIKIEEKSLDIPVVCRHCTSAPCMESCPEKSIVRDPRTGAVKILQDRCIGCKICISACPFGIIVVDPKTHEVKKCDLCDGNPACAKVCPTGAIVFARVDVGPRILMRSSTEKIEKNLAKLGGEE